jgi:hypothetical protein
VLRPVVFFVVEPLRLEVERDALRDVPDRVVPDREVPEVPDRDRVVPDEVPERGLDVPDVERARDVPDEVPERDFDVPDVEREVVVFLVPLLPVVFFRVVEPLRLVVERAELRAVPELDRVPVDRDVPEPVRARPAPPVARDDAARALEIPSSLMLSVPACSSPGTSGEDVCSPNASG